MTFWGFNVIPKKPEINKKQFTLTIVREINIKRKTSMEFTFVNESMDVKPPKNHPKKCKIIILMAQIIRNSSILEFLILILKKIYEFDYFFDIR